MSLTVRKFQTSEITPPQNLDLTGTLAKFKASESALDLEIGCGVGWHPIKYASANPDRNLIAVEQTREKFLSFERRHKAHPKLTNLLHVHAEAVRWVTHALEPSTIDRVFLLYPNPEPKAPNKRWFRMPFLERLLLTLKPGGTLTLATNIESYAEEAIAYATAVWGLKILERCAFTALDATAGLPRTHFEKKYLARGETCFDVTFIKS